VPAVVSVAEAAALNGARLLLWPEGAPGALGDRPEDQPCITAHLPPADKALGLGVLVAPGGGYRVLEADHEGLQVARWLNRQGIAAFVLRYRLGTDYGSDRSLADAQRALRLVRYDAASFGIATDRIGMLGFSAGGHLATALATAWDPGDAAATDPVERCGCRPDFVVPVYAVTNGAKRGRKADEYTASDERVTATTPPAFIVTSSEDAVVPAAQSTAYYDALRRAGVAAELHVFGFGDHGFGLGIGDANLARWPALLLGWLRQCGFMTTAARLPLEGWLTLDGAAPGLAWLSLHPEDPRAPQASLRLRASGPHDDGRFVFPAASGPTAGPHRARVYLLSRQVGTSTDGRYTLDDALCVETSVTVEAARPLRLALTLEGAQPAESMTPDPQATCP
jgi:acetyl esterase/lipase